MSGRRYMDELEIEAAGVGQFAEDVASDRQDFRQTLDSRSYCRTSWR